MKEREDKNKDIIKRIESDRSDFCLDKIQGLDLIIDTSEMSLSDVADEIYSQYRKLLKTKKESYYGSKN